MHVNQQIELKSREELKLMARAGAILREIRDRIGEKVVPGVTTRQLDHMAKQMLDARGAIPAFLGYQGFPGTLCTSVNEEIVHGIPSDRVLDEGDILSVDIGLVKDGFYADSARTYPVGRIGKDREHLLRVTEQSLKIATEYLIPGRRVGDLSHAVQEYVESEGLSVVREYTGHGIGRGLHEEPRIPNWGKAGRGARFAAGMVVAIEPMVNLGTHKTRVLDDQWTVVTADGAPSAHFENTIAVTKHGPRILT